VAKGRTYELAFRIGGLLAPSFGAATGEAGKKLTELQRKAHQLSIRGKALESWGAIGTAFRGVGTEALVMAAGLGAAAAAAGGGLFALAKSTADAADAAEEDAQKLGITIEALQELRYAASLSGVPVGALDVAINKMSMTLGQAAAGGAQAQKAFAALGLDFALLRKVSPDRALELVADRLAKMPDAASRAAAAQAILGRGARELGAMLAGGSAGLEEMRKQARATGNVLSGKTARDAAAFSDRLIDLQMTLAGLKNILGAALLPAFTDLFIRLADWLRTNQALVRQLAERFARWAVETLPKIIPLLETMRDLAIRVAVLTTRAAELAGGWDNLILAGAGFKLLTGSVSKLGVAFLTASPAAWEFAAALWANPVVWVVAGIVALVAATAALVVFWDDLVGWFSKASPAVKALTVVVGLLLTPLTIVPLILATIIHYWGTMTAAVRSFGAVAGVVIGAAAEVLWIVFGPAVRGAIQVMRIFGTIVAILGTATWGAVRAAVGAVLWLGGVLQPYWTAFMGWLTGIWEEWGGVVRSIIAGVLGRVLDLLSLLPGVGIAVDAARLAGNVGSAAVGAGAAAIANAPTGDAPNLAKLRGMLGGEAAAPIGSALAGVGSRSAAGGVDRSQTLSVNFNPQITVTSGEAGGSGLAAALKAASDDLLAKMKAALEQQQRLSYG